VVVVVLVEVEVEVEDSAGIMVVPTLLLLPGPLLLLPLLDPPEALGPS
jgi:hypothetical protein